MPIRHYLLLMASFLSVVLQDSIGVRLCTIPDCKYERSLPLLSLYLHYVNIVQAWCWGYKLYSCMHTAMAHAKIKFRAIVNTHIKILSFLEVMNSLKHKDSFGKEIF